jgi:hypothetical protein
VTWYGKILCYEFQRLSIRPQANSVLFQPKVPTDRLYIPQVFRSVKMPPGALRTFEIDLLNVLCVCGSFILLLRAFGRILGRITLSGLRQSEAWYFHRPG